MIEVLLYFLGIFVHVVGAVSLKGSFVSPPCFMNDDLIQSVEDLRFITYFEKIQDQVRQLKTSIELRLSQVS